MLTDSRLKAFEAVARCGSFTEASRELGISQPAVSQNVSALEKEIGSPLLQRVKGGIRITAKGEEVLTYARRILYWYERMDKVLIQGQTVKENPLVFDLEEGKRAEVNVVDGELRIKLL